MTKPKSTGPMSLKISNGAAGGAVEHADAAGRGGEVPVSGRKGKDVRRKGGGLFELVRNLSSEEFRESLLEAKIITKSGKLTKPYRD
jgi:hypothetical protein